MTNYYVTQGQNGGWNAKKEGAERASGNYETQKEAEKAAKNFCHNSGGGEVRIQGRDGKFRDSDTVKPGNDPVPPHDKKH
ncbi:MAG: DUF2188 domain-containing protein [Rickettsiales bacterium]|nr:DUF2188 domain-containing protein [Rickettsiales bacterium]